MSDRPTLEKEIAKHLRKLPSEQILSLATTLSQIKVWVVYRFQYELLAKCWQANRTGGDDPLAFLLESEDPLSQKIYDVLWLTTDYFNALWTLVQRVETLLKREYEKFGTQYPYASALDLFRAILKDRCDRTFKVYLQPHVTFSSRNMARMMRLKAKLTEGQALTKEEEEFLSKVLAPVKSMWGKNPPLEARIVAFAHKKATRGRYALSRAYSSYCDASAELSRCLAAQCEKEPSHQMSYGRLIKIGTKKGGSYREPLPSEDFTS